MKNKIVRTTLRIPEDLYKKIQLFENEYNLKTINSSSIKLIELGLIKFNEDSYIDDLLIKIMKQNELILNKLEEILNGK